MKTDWLQSEYCGIYFRALNISNIPTGYINEIKLTSYSLPQYSMNEVKISVACKKDTFKDLIWEYNPDGLVLMYIATNTEKNKESR